MMIKLACVVENSACWASYNKVCNTYNLLDTFWDVIKDVEYAVSQYICILAGHLTSVTLFLIDTNFNLRERGHSFPIATLTIYNLSLKIDKYCCNIDPIILII